MISGLSNVRSNVMPWNGCPMLNSSFADGLAWMLCSVMSLLVMVSV